MSEWKQVAALEDIPRLGSRVVKTATRDIAVFRTSEDKVFALHDHCPHKGAPVCRGIIGGTWPPCEPGEMKFEREGEVLICPWHGFEFDLVNGQELYQPDPMKLLMYPVVEKDGRVLVTV